jgi:hypothetical protein
MVFVETDGGRKMPMSVATTRTAPCPGCVNVETGEIVVARCPRCASSRQVHFLLAHFADCKQADQHRNRTPAASDLAADRERCKTLCAIDEGLTEWEVGFAESISVQVDVGRPLTDRQRQTADRILERLGQ